MSKNPRSDRATTISASDLLRLLPLDCKHGFLRQKTVNRLTKNVKWRHRLVILASTDLYIYENEMSKTPNMRIPLLGYEDVISENAKTCAWVFTLVPAISSLARCSFACASFADKTEWMDRVGEQLYKTNSISSTSISVETKGKYNSMEKISTEQETEYQSIDLPSTFDDEKKISNDKGKRDSDTILGNPLKLKPDLEEDEQDTIDITDEDTTLRADTPPRYSALLNGQEVHYQNSPSNRNAMCFEMEKACTIVNDDFKQDRDKCISMLKETNKTGAYLIRESRTNDYKVLAILTSDMTVREYRIMKSYGMYSLTADTDAEFPTIGALLVYYSSHRKLPSLDAHLSWGIHECIEMEPAYEISDVSPEPISTKLKDEAGRLKKQSSEEKQTESSMYEICDAI